MADLTLTPGNDVATFGTEKNTVRGLAANLGAGDVIEAGAGSAEDALLLDSAGTVDTRAGGNAAGLSGFEYLGLAAGTNQVFLSDAFVAGSFAGAASAGNFTVQGSAGNDSVNAAALGASSRVAFITGAGDDQFDGGAGADRVLAAASELTGADRLAGGGGVDALIITSAGAIAADALAQVTGIERIFFNAGGNTITLTQGAAGSAIGGLAVIGGAGADSVDASATTTRVGFNPGAGDDTFIGGSGDDQINMAVADLTAADAFDGRGGRDRIGFTTAGVITATMLSGLASIETLSLAEGDNTVTLGANLPTVNVAGRGGRDVVTLALATQYASLGGGDDTLRITAASAPGDSSYGGAGTDTIEVRGGGTAVIGARVVEFERVVLVDPGTVDISATVAALQVITTSGNDGVIGSTRSETFDGGAGDDTLRGGGGTDTLIGGLGNDTLDGGPGNDTASYADAPGAVTVSLLLAGAQNTGAAGNDTLIGIERLIGSAFNDTLIGNGEANELRGGAGNDTLRGEGGPDRLFGGPGNDTLIGGSGFDTADYSAAAGGIVADLQARTVSNDGDGGQDTLSSVETITGSPFADTISGTSNGDTLIAGAGNDTLFGRSGNDTLGGGAGDDTLEGGAGSDRVVGGAGNDRFVFRARTEGTDRLADFVAGGTDDVMAFLATAFPLFNGQASVQVNIDTSAGGTLPAGVDVVGRTGVADAAAVDAYLAGAAGTFAGGVFVLGQATAGGEVVLYYDPNAALAGGAGAAARLGTFPITVLTGFTAADFVFI
jgi:Ca2+-binding RTX toxin-like protein